jgi:ABC-type nitrate/sulfonate/bicarbonate transport system substrate-binding protein
MKSPQFLFSICLAGLGPFVAVLAVGAQTPLQKVRIAYASSGINYADIFLAKEKGFFREEGLEPQFIQMNSSIAITAGISGELDGQAL